MSWMDAALAQAAAVRGTTAPNPAVGAVLVRDGGVIGAGGTQPVGGLHAERVALLDCATRGIDPRGATLYATLEPCCHHGRQPPCTDAVIASGIARVVIGVLDPNPQMRGRSVDLLRAAGIEVEVGVQEDACERSILGFARSITRGLPEVTVKTATSADGCIATASGESQWITGEAARAVGQRLRAEHDGILVGIGTALADDPRLTCRIPGASQPVPIVLDTHLRLRPGSHLDRPETLVFCGPDAVVGGLRVTAVPVPLDGAQVDVGLVMRELAARGLHRILVEGGAMVTRSLLDGGLVDTVEQFIAGRLLPGGRSFVGGPPIQGLDRYALRLAAHRPVGDDLHLTWVLEHTATPDWVEDACSPD